MIPAVERPAGCALATRTRFTTLCTAALAFVIIAWPSFCLAGFSNAAPMHDARWGHTATLLPSGKVLVAGGNGVLTAGGITAFISLASTELYDPASNTWSAAGSMTTARVVHTATLLPSGQVLVAGGHGTAPYLSSAELYDPASNTWSAAGSMATGRGGHTATLLPSGQVLVAGGSGSGTLASAELYDPASNTWSAAGSMASPRVYLTATLLPSGQVLVVGASDSSSSLAGSELYDPGSNTWTIAAPMAGPAGLVAGYTATLLLSGQVVVAGGEGIPPSFNIPPPRFAIAELYDPGSNTWSSAGSMARGRADHTATLLPSGQVLVAGGSGGSSVLASAELYDPASNTWSTTDSMATARNLHTATLLRSGKTLVAGGVDSSDIGGPQVANVFASTELYDPQTQTAVEYYYAAWNYYFVTSFPDEIAALDGGAFGGLWRRTGETFNVWPQPNASASPTCRFFSTSFAPKSSHFYTPFPAECAIVKTNPNWQFESVAFYVQIPNGYGTGNGSCPQGTLALYRAYNNGMGGAPNHRYTTSSFTLNTMLAQGWLFEGEANTKVFACVPQ